MIPDWLSWIDVAYVGIALFFAWGGSQKGFAAQVAHILTCLAMGAVLFFAYPFVFNFITGQFRRMDETALMWLLLIGVFVLAIGIFLLCTKLLAGLIKAEISPRTDTVNGFILGFIRGLLVTLFVMIFLVMLGPVKFYETFRQKSYVGKAVCYEMVPRIHPHLSPAAMEEKVQGLKNKLLDREEAGVIEI